jgi:phage terminase large subunit GpA-like protein
MVPQKFAEDYCGGPIKLITCTVDVHHNNLAVTITGWTEARQFFTIEYWRLQDNSEQGCESIDSPVWTELTRIIEAKYGGMHVSITLIDSGFANDTVCSFCYRWEAGVYPIVGRTRRSNTNIREFADFKTQIGTYGYQVNVDYYKDRLSAALRRHWTPDAGEQKMYTYNAPVNLDDAALKELTVEFKREKINDAGVKTYEWHRPGNAPNELWDLSVYAHAALEIYAWEICSVGAGLDVVDWEYFWRENG